jgi:hypothetical protein
MFKSEADEQDALDVLYISQMIASRGVLGVRLILQ